MSRNQSDFQLERADGISELIPNASRSGYSFVKWCDATGNELSADSLSEGKIFYAEYKDDIAPVISLETTEELADKQTISITASDEGSGIAGYYIGTADPALEQVEFCASNKGVATDTGIYYCSVKDWEGNVTTSNIKFNRFTLHMNDGTGSDKSILLADKKTVVLPLPERNGYTGVWVEDSTGDIVNIIVPDNNESYTAQWTPNTYLLSFHANGGTVGTNEKEVIFDSTYGELPIPVRAGYTFNGWYTNTSGGEKIISDTIVKILEDQCLYARWTASSTTPSYWICGYGVFSHTDSAGNIKAKCENCGALVDAIGAPHRIYVN